MDSWSWQFVDSTSWNSKPQINSVTMRTTKQFWESFTEDIVGVHSNELLQRRQLNRKRLILSSTNSPPTPGKPRSCNPRNLPWTKRQSSSAKTKTLRLRMRIQESTTHWTHSRKRTNTRGSLYTQICLRRQKPGFERPTASVAATKSTENASKRKTR